MNGVWQLQEAKNKLSEVVDKAAQDGPQRITRRGKAAAVVISVKDYERLKRGKQDLVHFLMRSPLRGVDLERVKDLPRETGL
ncbi:MAG: type II toxin-antitoxin system Phd/YefM family antitoxin [Candidatus Hydrogenedentes bacterium]|nr:type II toxin-antitoxin system Phd/YefM family antitoxin [Candidatus Hydrogenedentota bacterium]